MCIFGKVLSIVEIFKNLYLDWLQTTPGICLLEFINILSAWYVCLEVSEIQQMHSA